MRPTILILPILILAACGKPQAEAPKAGADSCGQFVGTYRGDGNTVVIEPGCILKDTHCAYDASFSPPTSNGQTTFSVAASQPNHFCYQPGKKVGCVITTAEVNAVGNGLSLSCGEFLWTFQRIQ